MRGRCKMPMKRRKPFNDLTEAGLGLGVASVGLGVTAGVIEKIGGDASPISTLGMALKPAATLMGTGAVIGQLKEIGKKKQRR